jgi:hypothetical protein
MLASATEVCFLRFLPQIQSFFAACKATADLLCPDPAAGAAAHREPIPFEATPFFPDAS